MTPARRRHPALAMKLDASRTELTVLVQSIRRTAAWRDHTDLITEYLSDTQTRLTCPHCGMDADANTKPAANGIDIGGELVAMNCKTFIDEHVEIIEVKL